MDHRDERFFIALRLRTYKSLTPEAITRLETATISGVGDLITILSPYDVGECVEKRVNLTEEAELLPIQRALFRCWTGWLEREAHLSRVSERVKDVVGVLSAYCRVDCLARFISSRTDVCGIMGSGMYGELGSEWVMSDLLSALKSRKLVEAELLEDALRELGAREEMPDAEMRERIAIELRRQYFKKLKEVVRPFKDRNLMSAVSLVEAVETVVRPDLRRAVKSGGGELPKSLWRLGERVVNAVREVSGDNISVVETLVSGAPAFVMHHRLGLLPVGPSAMMHYFIIKCWETFFVSHIIYSVLKGAPPEYVKEWIKRWGVLHERLYS